MISARRRATALAALLLVPFASGCGPRAPRFSAPTRLEAFCGSKQARMTGLASVVTSTDDKVLDDRPTAADVRRAVTAGDGVIVSWHDQPIALPNVSKMLGETDGYAKVLVAAVPPAPAGALSRHIYLLVRDHGGERWITMQAFDVQNVCVEGKRES
ncbi:MAG: hypothetical protein IAI50_16960 [Candidatus Eremiobacteraeota bacterium]|nr:hypothetical protein [Candidatus Eremiobacteraeota bacterium]